MTAGDRRPVGDEELALDAHARDLDRGDLLEQCVRVDDDARADDGRLPAHDSGGKEMEREVTVGELDGVAGVVSAVVAGDDVEAIGEEIDDFSLSLVTPLPSEDGRDFHGTESYQLSAIGYEPDRRLSRQLSAESG